MNKVDIGNRTLIISADDQRSQDLSKRMWFEMQKVGIEAGFYTTKTAFCCSASVQEGLEIVRRTGTTLVYLFSMHRHIHTQSSISTLDCCLHTLTHSLHSCTAVTPTIYHYLCSEVEVIPF